MSKPIIVFKARKMMCLEELDEYRRMFLEQMSEGVVVVPIHFDVIVANPKQLECEIEEVENE